MRKRASKSYNTSQGHHDNEDIKTTKPKSARGRGRRMKTKAELREEMLKTLNDSNYKKL